MLSLFLHIVLLSSFELIVKRGINRRMDMLTIGTLNFAISAPLATLLLYGQTSATVEWATLGLGTLMGACYFLSFFFILYAIAQQGVAATRAVIQLAILIPIAFSIFLWNEHPQGMQTVGIIIAVGSLFLLGGRRDLGRRKRATLRWKLAAGLVLVGTARVSAKAFSEMKAPEETAFFLIALFASAAIAATVKLLWQRPAISPRAWALGSVLGGLNVIHSVFPDASAASTAWNHCFSGFRLRLPGRHDADCDSTIGRAPDFPAICGNGSFKPCCRALEFDRRIRGLNLASGKSLTPFGSPTRIRGSAAAATLAPGRFRTRL